MSDKGKEGESRRKVKKIEVIEGAPNGQKHIQGNMSSQD
jgi:hypothetical protein